MRRVLLSCLTSTAHLVFLLVVAAGGPCAEGCPDDGPDGTCPPACRACPCAPKAGRAGAPAALQAPPAPASRCPALVATAPPAPDPRDIFHVPEHLLA